MWRKLEILDDLVADDVFGVDCGLQQSQVLFVVGFLLRSEPFKEEAGELGVTVGHELDVHLHKHGIQDNGQFALRDARVN